MRIDTLAIVGVGLIGGSIALAARRRLLAQRIVGVGRRENSLETARMLGIIDEGFTDLAAGVGSADVVVFCTPVDVIAEQVIEAAPHCNNGVLLTDAGSTKAAIVQQIEDRLPDGVFFVGSHPLAGSEKTGAEHARADLLQDRLTIVTPSESSEPSAVERVCDFWQLLGAQVSLLSPEEHDRALALTSHLPHLVAAALAGILPDRLHQFAATGFRDTTRIAAGDPSIWTGIFQQNRSAVLRALQRLIDQIVEFQQALGNDDKTALDSLLLQGKEVRDALGN